MQQSALWHETHEEALTIALKGVYGRGFWQKAAADMFPLDDPSVIRNQVRKHLARRHDPKKRAERYVEQGTGDMFGEHLQDYYPVRRCGDSGAQVHMYAKLETLSRREINSNISRMTKAGESLLKHADALRAWEVSRAA